LPPAVNLREGLLIVLCGVIALSASLQMPSQRWRTAVRAAGYCGAVNLALPCKGGGGFRPPSPALFSTMHQAFFVAILRMSELSLMLANAFVQILDLSTFLTSACYHPALAPGLVVE